MLEVKNRLSSAASPNRRLSEDNAPVNAVNWASQEWWDSWLGFSLVLARTTDTGIGAPAAILG
ncbi:hypothetical protein MPNT_530005 [Candidatus Methylacidithermus pantelleriae]|uniref:Uncharacterized protein n=1 Tax=Candidatus Methylacidithermus pantelleriae TaxID=2744239 RepID=A0A8J2FPJ5_9BACT|nr:hypothetical protein MPNT_530005 [Candidatus Methylacidithermus pantelleriae]